MRWSSAPAPAARWWPAPWRGPVSTPWWSRRGVAGRSKNSVPPTRSTVMPGCTAAAEPPSRWDARRWCCRSAARSAARPSSTPAPASGRRLPCSGAGATNSVSAWPTRTGWATQLDEVERTLQVAPVPLEIMGRNGRLLLDAADSLGWQAAPIPRNAPGCDGCCQCAIGCPDNAKFGVHLNALPQACAAGARIVSHARAERVLHRARTRPRRACPPARRHRDRRPRGHGRRRRGRHRDAGAVAAQRPWRTPASRPQPCAASGDDARRALRRRRVRVAWRAAERRGARVSRVRRRADRGDLDPAGDGINGLSPATAPSCSAGWTGRRRSRRSARWWPTRASARCCQLRGETLVRYNIARADVAKLMIALEAMGRLLFAAGAARCSPGCRMPRR